MASQSTHWRNIHDRPMSGVAKLKITGRSLCICVIFFRPPFPPIAEICPAADPLTHSDGNGRFAVIEKQNKRESQNTKNTYGHTEKDKKNTHGLQTGNKYFNGKLYDVGATWVYN